jgi:hypothetical protein
LDDGRRSREETTIQLRKSKKDEVMKKRRGMLPSLLSSTCDVDLSSSNNASDLMEQSPQQLVLKYKQWLSNPASVSDQELHDTTKAFRRLLTKENDVLVEQVIASGAIPFFVMMLSKTEYLDLLLEASWALTNVASTSYAGLIVAEAPGAVQQLAHLLFHSSPHVREQVAWCLGNISGDSIELRDQVLETPGVVDGMYVSLSLLCMLCLADGIESAISHRVSRCGSVGYGTWRILQANRC